MGGIVRSVVKPVQKVFTSLLGEDNNPFAVRAAELAAQPAAPQPAPAAVPTVAQTQAAAAETQPAPRARAAAAPLGVTELPRRRRRSSRVNTLLSDLNEDRLGG